MIGPARVANRQRRHAQAAERLHPLAEDRRDGWVALEIHAAQRAGAVVDVEVAGEFGMVRLELIAGLTSAAAAATAALAGLRGRILTDREVHRHVLRRAVEALFFSGPESDPYGAPQRHA